MTESAIHAITMPLRLWLVIDAQMDNKAQEARDQYWEQGGQIGDPARPDVGPTARLATGIRQEGVSQTRSEWRPSDELIEVRLTREQWEFVLAVARDRLAFYETLARQEDPPADMRASAELRGRIVTVVDAALAENAE